MDFSEFIDAENYEIFGYINVFRKKNWRENIQVVTIKKYQVHT